MGTLHTHNAYPLFILRSRRNFFHREREQRGPPFGHAAGAREARAASTRRRPLLAPSLHPL